jgi:hypothetical protein
MCVAAKIVDSIVDNRVSVFLLAQRTEPRTRFREGRLQFGVDGLADGPANTARADFDSYCFPPSGLPLSQWCVSARSIPTLVLLAGIGCGQ